MSSPESIRALHDLKVIDLGHYISGPYCAFLLAGLGAEVIKVERPGTGDGSRQLGPFPNDEPHIEKGGLFNYLNLGKKSITVNLKVEEGKDVLRRLVAQSDVLIENFEPRVMPSLGLAYEDLKKINPRLVMLSISNYGQTGPYRDYRGFEIAINALSGVMAEVGEPDREPVKLGGSQLQYETGLTAAFAVMSAICYRDVTGIGQHLDMSLIEVSATLKGASVMTYQQQGFLRTRNGVRVCKNPYVPPPADNKPPPGSNIPNGYIGILLCKDGYMCIDPELPQQWEDFCDMMERPELKDDPRFSIAAQGAYVDELDPIIIDYLKDKTQREVFETASDWRVPTGIVNDMGKLFQDPQHHDRGYFVEVDHPALGKMTYPGHPLIMSKTPWQASRAPLLGEDNKDIIIKRLGYSERELASMVKQGVI